MRIKRFEVGARRAPTHAQAGGDQPLGQRIRGDAFSEARIAPATITASPRNVSGSIIVNSSPNAPDAGNVRCVALDTLHQLADHFVPGGMAIFVVNPFKKIDIKNDQSGGVRVSVSLMR